MQFNLFREEKEDLVLFVPSYFDEEQNKWFASLKVPKAKTNISAEALDAQELKTCFEKALEDAIRDFPDIVKLFKPAKFWKGVL